MTGRDFDAIAMAYELDSLIRVCRLASDPELQPQSGDNGVERALTIAERLMGAMIDHLETKGCKSLHDAEGGAVMSQDSIYKTGGGYDAKDIAYRLHGLCKVGSAASDSVLEIDLTKGGWQELFETMAGLCDDLVAAMDAEKSATP